MNKIIPFIIVTLVFLSCKKEEAALQQSEPDVQKSILTMPMSAQLARKVELMMKHLPREEYHAMYTNVCHPEAVEMMGTVVSSYKAYTLNNIGYVTLHIVYDEVSGRGTQSGLAYTGGGEYSDLTRIYPDGSATIFVLSREAYGTDHGDSIIMSNKSKFLYAPDGTITVEYNDVINRCK